MLKKFTKDFKEFVNESAESKVRGISLEEFLPLFSELVMMCPNLEEFNYPSDIHGHASRVIELSRNGKSGEPWMFTKESGLSEMEKKLNEIEEFYRKHYDGKDKPVFYVWNVSTKGLKYRELEKRLEEVGGLPKSEQDFKLPQLIDLLKNDETLRNAVTRVSASLDSISSTEFGKAMSRGDFGPLD